MQRAVVAVIGLTIAVAAVYLYKTKYSKSHHDATHHAVAHHTQAHHAAAHHAQAHHAQAHHVAAHHAQAHHAQQLAPNAIILSSSAMLAVSSDQKLVMFLNGKPMMWWDKNGFNLYTDHVGSIPSVPAKIVPIAPAGPLFMSHSWAIAGQSKGTDGLFIGTNGSKGVPVFSSYASSKQTNIIIGAAHETGSMNNNGYIGWCISNKNNRVACLYSLPTPPKHAQTQNIVHLGPWGFYSSPDEFYIFLGRKIMFTAFAKGMVKGKVAKSTITSGGPSKGLWTS